MAGSSGWRFLSMLAVVAGLSLLFVAPADAQECNLQCGSHAYCYWDYRGVPRCACNGYYVGDGYQCKYSTWRLVLYILTSVIGFILIFFLCLSCLGYFRRRQPQPVGYPMQPMPGYGYPPPGPPAPASANPAMYSYPPQPGYPAAGYPPQVANPGVSNKVPGPSGTV